MKLIPEWVQSIIGGILIFVGVSAFGLCILSLIIVLLIIDSRGNAPSMLGLLQFGIFMFICFWICAIGTKIHPKGRAWLNEGKEPNEKKEPKMMW